MVSPLVRIRAATPADVPAIVAIERAAFADPWSARMFTVCMHSGVHMVLVAERGEGQGAVVGFVVIQIVSADAEVLDIAVADNERGQGVGRILLDAALEQCARLGGVAVTLEVRESNVAARALYASRQFHIVGRRRRYYHSPVEDGLILKVDLPVSTGSQQEVQRNADA
jgi:ribosomal-protein-alanine N-acetyltransferase